MATSKITAQTGIIPFILNWPGQTIATSGYVQLAFSDATDLSNLTAKMAPGVSYTIDVSGCLAITAAGYFYGIWVKNDASYTASTIGTCVARVRAIGSNANPTTISIPMMLIPVRI